MDIAPPARPPFPEFPRLAARGPAAGGAREGCRSSRTLPRDARPHCCGASAGGEGGGGCAWDRGCWSCCGCCGCCGRPLIPCPILECYSVTYNRVTRAAADVPTASIGHRNKEGRVPGSGLYNPELRDALIGSELPQREGRGVGAAARPHEIRSLTRPGSPARLERLS